jgi:hypothetical protein
MAEHPAPALPPPSRRLLRAYAFDPMSTRLNGRFLTVNVRFEPGLAPGPSGELVQVVDYDAFRRVWYRPVDLNDPYILAQQGMQPSESDPRTHQQIVYAVAMSVIERFERFGGRRFRWIGKDRLTLIPHAFEGRNAFFDPDRGAVLFGYYRASAQEPGANLPGQLMFTCLSVDIIAHEVTHAIVHRIRRRYREATNPDVYAWHEAFADLVALFHHFLFPEVVENAIAGSEGEMMNASALFELAREFGESTGRGAALRSAIDAVRTPEAYLSATEPHERGACFVAAVFDAYLDTYKASISSLRRLATGGSGILPPGALPPDLVKLATREAVQSADRLLGMVVRAFDFLPVIDVTFGDVVRAIITSDRALFPDDALRLRATLVEALRRRGIRPSEVTSLADEALQWESPELPLSLSTGTAAVDLSALMLDATRQLDLTDSLADLGADAGTAPEDASGPTAAALQKWGAAHAVSIGLDPALPVQVVGQHVAYLQAADGQPRPFVVVQYLQRHPALEEPVADGDEPVRMYSGTTVIAKVNGEVDYLIAKPLPMSGDPLALALGATNAGSTQQIAQYWDGLGRLRLERVRAWFEEAESADAMAAWTSQPAVQRMTFSQLHANLGEVD